MTISHISTTLFNNVAGSYFEIIYTQTGIAAVAGDKITVFVFWRRDAAQNIASILWGAVPLTIEGTTYTGIEGTIATYSCIANASATNSIVLTFDGYCYCNAAVTVARDSAVGTISSSGLLQQKYDTGGYVAPSLTVLSVPTGALSISVLFATAYDTGFTPLPATTWTGNQTARGNIQNTGTNSIGRAYVQTAAGVGSNITHSYVASAGSPMYNHFAYYLDAAPAYQIDTINSPVYVGGTGYTLTTTGMGTITSLSYDGKACTITAASPGSCTFSLPTFSHGVTNPETTPEVANQIFTASDGTLSDTITSVVNTITGDTAVVMAGALDTGEFSICKDPAIVLGDAVSLPTAAGTLNANGTLTDYVFGTYTMWRREAATGIMYTSQLTVSETGVNNDGGVASRHIASKHISSRGISLRHITS